MTTTNFISSCCGASDRSVTYKGPSFEDIGICPECRDHCEFVSDEENECAPQRAPIDPLAAIKESFVTTLAAVFIGGCAFGFYVATVVMGGAR